MTRRQVSHLQNAPRNVSCPGTEAGVIRSPRKRVLNVIIYTSVSTSGVNTYVVVRMGDKKPQTGDIFMCGQCLKSPMCSD